MSIESYLPALSARGVFASASYKIESSVSIASKSGIVALSASQKDELMGFLSLACQGYVLPNHVRHSCICSIGDEMLMHSLNKMEERNAFQCQSCASTQADLQSQRYELDCLPL